MDKTLGRLSVEETAQLARKRSRRNMIVVAALVLFVMSIFAFSLYHIGVETSASRAGIEAR